MVWSVQRYTQSPRAKNGELVNAIDVPSLTFYGGFLFKEKAFMCLSHVLSAPTRIRRSLKVDLRIFNRR